MATEIFQSSPTVQVPISLEQLATGIRKLSRSELLTLELLLDKKAMGTIKASLKAQKQGRAKPFKVG